MNLMKPQQSKQPWQSLHDSLNHLKTLFSSIIRIPNFSTSITFALSSSIFNCLYKKNLALSTEEIKKRMAGIPVYTMTDYKQTRCSAVSAPGRDIEFYFISKADAENYLQYMDRTGDMQILDIPLAHIVDCEGETPPIRLVPELSQVYNAMEERKNDIARYTDDKFSGVPVFQTDELVIVSRKQEIYRPCYLRKEDLKKTLVTIKGSEDTDTERATIQVASLEEIIRDMKDPSTSKWNDVLFVGPGITSWTWF